MQKTHEAFDSLLQTFRNEAIKKLGREFGVQINFQD